jgi:hypothetical protein
MIFLDESGTLNIKIEPEAWNGEGEVTSGDYVGKYRHAELHAVNKSYYRMEKKENLAFGLLSDSSQSMKLPKESNWVTAIEKYPLGRVVTIDKVKFEIASIDVYLTTEAFNSGKDITEAEDFYLEVYFRLEGTTVNPNEIIISL